ncbi:MAG: hypothetical protein WCJ62_00740 [Flavobacterium sp.]
MNGKLHINSILKRFIKYSAFNWVCLLLLVSCTWMSNAQCSVYTVFESFRGAAGISGATAASPAPITGYTQGCYTGCPSACVISDYWYGFGIADPNSATSSYSGVHSMRFSGSSSAYLITPKITTANSATFTLSFYYKLVSGTTAGTLKVEYSTSSSANSNPNGATWNTVTGTGTPTSTSSSIWSQCTGTITAAQAPTGFYIKITRTNASGGVMLIDDLSWTSSVNSENTAIVASNPAMTCYTTSIVALNSLDTSKTYTLYDNGGDSDSYNPSQDNKIQIVPPAGFKVVAKVNSVAVTTDGSCGDTDWIKIWYALPTSGSPDNWIQTGCATRPVPTNSLISAETATSASTTNDGSVLIEFKSDGTAVAASDNGCNITITFVPKDCLDVFGPNITSITSSTASLNWFSNVAAGVGYDYYVSTSNVSPPINSTTDVTPSSNAILQIGTVSSSNIYSTAITSALSGLSSNKAFYVWVRSNCSSSSHGSWIPITNSGGSFTTLSSCGSATPVPGTYTLDYQSNPSANQSCTSVLNGSFASYNSINNAVTGNNYIATNAVSSWYVLAPLALTAGFTYQVSVDFGSAVGGSSNFLVNYVQTAGPITATALTVGGGAGAVNIINTSPSTTTLTTVNSTTFVASTTGTYYIGILLNSTVNAGLFDNINVKQVCGAKTWNGTAWSPLGTPTLNDNLIFNGSYTSPGNGTTMLGCSCTVTSGTVIFGANDTLSLTNTVTVTGGSLTFNNNASLYQLTNLPNSGTINYKRDTTTMVVDDYTYWSSPVANFLLSGISGSAYYSYDASLATPAWKVASSASPMDVGKGYIARTSSAGIYTATFAGTPNNGTYTTTVYGGSNQVNLIGNPYPSAISALSLINDTDNYMLGGTLYFWTHNTPITGGSYSFSDYALYNIVGSVGTGTPSTPGANSNPPNGSIAAGQGFFVKGLITGPVSATFKNSMRLTTGNNQFFKSASTNSLEPTIERHRVWLDISNAQGAYKQMLVGYIDGATAAIDNKFDAEIFNVGNPIMIYSVVDNTKLTIDGRGLPFDQNDTVKIGYKATVDGTFTISSPNFDGLFTTQNIYLEDKFLHIIHDLKTGSYSFSTMAGSFEDRFVLRYTTNALNNPKPLFDSNTVIIYTDSQGLHVNSGAINMNNVKIYDIMGRLITQQESINDTKTLFQTMSATKQFVIVQVTSVDGVVVTKKVLY